ncbi:DEAD/DEAH box helicase [Streptomyces bottropensis]|uniref:DEAD/DEAH box helicase n=3 Tax=Streptomyces TaxID=1883 RepID=UPI00036C9B66|nr:DEAD/DEAH box helicase [Streptomyces bottropensis]
MTLPVALTGTDIIGQAKTGTGKTLGFGLPLLERVVVPADVEAGRAKPEDLVDSPQALVVVPTRELCTQVTNDLLTAGKVRNVRVTAIYGGRAYEPQVEALKKGVDVVIGTPGRLLDLAGQKKLNLKHVKCLVLDEADEMLDLGFLPDVEKIINMLPARRQTMLFSATMPGAVIGLARRYMSQPTHISATSPDDEGATVRNTAQHIYRAHNMDKPEIVSRILQADGRGLVMVFCRTKRTAADLADQLKQRGFASGAVHGDLGQGAREQALRAFRNGKVDVLVCTDVAARGIDVEGVTHVINYQSPEDEKTYLHRIGRTGRAGAKGIAITLVDWDDIPRWQLINKALNLGFNDPPETYSTSPHLFEELSIPTGTKGVLPRSERTRAGLEAEELEDLGEPGGRGPRGRGGRSSAPSSSAERERERPARTPRRRRRTRSGATVDGVSPEAAAVTQPSESARTPDAGSVESEGESRTPRRRRRTRTGANPGARSPRRRDGSAEQLINKALNSVVQRPARGRFPPSRWRGGRQAASGRRARPQVRWRGRERSTGRRGPGPRGRGGASPPRRRPPTPSVRPGRYAPASRRTRSGRLERAGPSRRLRAREEPREGRRAPADPAVPGGNERVTASALEDESARHVAAHRPTPDRAGTRGRPRSDAAAVAWGSGGTAPESRLDSSREAARVGTPVGEARRAHADGGPRVPRRAAESAIAPEPPARAAWWQEARARGEAAGTAERRTRKAPPPPWRPRRARRAPERHPTRDRPRAPRAATRGKPAARGGGRRRGGRARAACRTRKPPAPRPWPPLPRRRSTPPGTAAEEAPAKPRRRTRKVAAPAEAVVEETTAEEAPAAPRRRTRKAATAAVEATDSAAEATLDTVEEPKPRRRARKTVAEAAEAAVPAQPTQEQATKPRRTRKAAVAAPAAVGEEAVAETPAPRRRARKAAAAVEAAES